MRTMLILKHLVAVTVSICLSYSVFATENDYDLQLKQFYTGQANLMKDALDRGEFLQLRYTVVSEILNQITNKYEDANDECEIITGRNFRYINSAGLEVYMDNSDVFTISKKNKTVVHTPPDRKLLAQDFSQQLADGNFIRGYKVISSARVKETGDSTFLIRYDLQPINPKQAAYSYLAIYLDEPRSSLKKLTVKINPISGKEVKEYTLKVIQRNVIKLDSSWFPIKKKILNADGQLRKTYSSYSYRRIF